MTGRRFWLAAMVLPAFLFAPSAANADAMSDAYALVLASPQSVEANFAYARLAEQAGQYQRALATYERIVLLDPDNEEALDALKRVRLILQPVINTRYAEAGLRWETNPRANHGPGEEEFIAFGRFNYTDERTLGAMRWRTALGFLGEVYFESSDLNYADASILTGPVFQFGTGLSLHTALGGTVAYFDNQFYYGEAELALTFRWLANDAVQSLRVRGGYRDYGDSFVTDNGFYVDALANLVFADVDKGPGALVLSPWVRFSDIGGSITDISGFVDEPGTYIEVGARLAFDVAATDWMNIGAGVSVSGRFFDSLAFGSSDNRSDLLLVPEAFVTFPDLLGDGVDLKFAYQYQWRDSNSPPEDFINHTVSASIVFDR